MRDALEARFGPPESAQAGMAPDHHASRWTRSARRAVLKLIDALEESDDVQNVYANFEVPEAVLARLSA